MKQQNLTKLILSLLVIGLISCGGSGSGGTESAVSEEAPQSMLSNEPRTLEEAEKDWQSNNGVGPVSSLNLPEAIDQTMADAGQIIYEAKCTACHKIEKNFIGPSPKGIINRRTPAWIMNMILDPEGMVKNDPIARQLLIKFNGAPMANQSLTEDDARNVLEYFRTL